LVDETGADSERRRPKPQPLCDETSKIGDETSKIEDEMQTAHRRRSWNGRDAAGQQAGKAAQQGNRAM